MAITKTWEVNTLQRELEDGYVNKVIYRVKGSDGKAIYFRSSSIANDSDIDAANVGGRNGGTATGSFN